MTATGLTSPVILYSFSSVDCVFSAAPGGTFSPSGVTFCKKKACDHNGSWEVWGSLYVSMQIRYPKVRRRIYLPELKGASCLLIIPTALRKHSCFPLYRSNISKVLATLQPIGFAVVLEEMLLQGDNKYR